MNLRTDLAMEDHALWRRSAKRQTKLSGVRAREETEGGVKITSVEILDEEGERALGKPRGTYVTLECMPAHEPAAFAAQSALLSRHIRALLPAGAHVLVAGLGNEAVTPDAVGPLAAECVLVTRHLKTRLPEEFAAFRPVSVFRTGVLGTTGIESAALVRGVVSLVRPDRVIAVDALSAREAARLCRAVQVSDAGIVPGSGVGNARSALTEETLGVPVVAVGVPTVVDARTLCADLSGAEIDLPEDTELFVTPRDIDTRVRDSARLVGYAIDLALHDALTIEDIDMFLA